MYMDFIMEETSSDESSEEEDMRIRQDEEYAILKLFTLILDVIIKDKKLKHEDIEVSINSIRSSFNPRIFHETDFTKWENICAYLYRYGSHGAGFARYRILDAIRNCEEVENILRKPDLKVIFLGSGPGNGAVGLCSALSKLQYPKSLKLTLVDKFKEWNECIKLAENFIKSKDFGRVSKLFERTNVDFHFIQVDLPGDLKSDEKYFKILGEADVIVANKFFISLNRGNDGAIERSIINSLHEHMKEDAVILVNDFLVHIENRWRDFRLIGMSPDEEYVSMAFADNRFGSDDMVHSKLRTYVFVKESAKREFSGN